MGCAVSSGKLNAVQKKILPSILKSKFGSIVESSEEFNTDFFLKYKIKQAEEILEKANELFNGKMVLAFSGGKDSLVVLHLAQKIIPDIKVLYNNSTIEFPETIEYVKILSNTWGFDLEITQPKESFFKLNDIYGWATHEDRWCCGPCKEEPAASYIKQKGFLAEITGTTRTESIYRRSLKPIKLPSKRPYFIRINPIFDWNTQEVWKYIEMNDLPCNPIYEMGYRRCGCWCCPINGPSHYARLEKTHPKFFNMLLNYRYKHPQITQLLEKRRLKAEAKIESALQSS
jgi:phosphoadenylyl-sulfate reductase (thioredoxin)